MSACGAIFRTWASNHPVLGGELEEPVGNFPQAFTHIGVINAALALEARAARERGEARAAPEAEALTGGKAHL